MQDKCLGMLTFGVVFLHDNTCLKSARKTQRVFEAIQIGRF